MASEETTETVTSTSTSTSAEKKGEEEEYKLECIVAKSAYVGKIGFLHYLAMFLWLGWFAFFMYFPVFFVLLMLVSPLLVGVLVAVIVTSAVYPLSDRRQPKVSTSSAYCSCVMSD